MPATTDDRILQETPKGHHRKVAPPSQHRLPGNGSQRQQSATPSDPLSGNATGTKLHWPISPSASGDDTDVTIDDRFTGRRRSSLTGTQKQRINLIGQNGDMFQANGHDPVARRASSSETALIRSEEDDTVDEEDGPSKAGASNDEGRQRVRKLSSADIYELTSSPQSLPLHSQDSYDDVAGHRKSSKRMNDYMHADSAEGHDGGTNEQWGINGRRGEGAHRGYTSSIKHEDKELCSTPRVRNGSDPLRSPLTPLNNTVSGMKKRSSSKWNGFSDRSPRLQGSRHIRPTPTPLSLNNANTTPKHAAIDPSMPSPMPPKGLPAPPLSLPTWLQLELSSDRSTPRHHYHSTTSDIPYESSAVKMERLLNFLLLPPQLEQVLWFGALACLDAWLYSFTILPLRFLKALSILVQSWGTNVAKEIRYLGSFIYSGAGRMWHRQRRRSSGINPLATDATPTQRASVPKGLQRKEEASIQQDDEKRGIADPSPQPNRTRKGSATYRRHRRTKSTPSALRQSHKADLLKGLLILISCTILMRFDASRMYHGIRGQAAIKLYVIYNVLEVRIFASTAL